MHLLTSPFFGFFGFYIYIFIFLSCVFMPFYVYINFVLSQVSSVYFHKLAIAYKMVDRLVNVVVGRRILLWSSLHNSNNITGYMSRRLVLRKDSLALCCCISVWGWWHSWSGRLSR